MTLAHFKAEIARLQVLRFAPAMLQEHWTLVRLACEDETFSAAISRCLCTRSEFPTPAELLEDVRTVQAVAVVIGPEPDRSVPLPEPIDLSGPSGIALHLTREWRYCCEVCRDSGWQEQTCPEAPCGHTFPHGPHDWVAPCVCVQINPAIQRRYLAQVRHRAGSRSC